MVPSLLQLILTFRMQAQLVFKVNSNIINLIILSVTLLPMENVHKSTGYLTLSY